MRTPGFAVAQTNRFSATVRKLLGLKGEEHDVTYGVHLEEERPEYSFLKNEVLWVQVNQATSAAGTVCIVGVQNPTGSGILTVVTAAWASVEAAGVNLALKVNRAPVTLGAVGRASMHPRDTRYMRAAGGNATQSLGGAGTLAAAGADYTADLRTSLAANDVMDFIAPGGRVQPIILAPGGECFIVTDPVGVHTLTATFVGYERSLESGELI